MNHKSTAELAEPLLELINSHQNQSDEPCFVALDGRGGSGKSTLAAYIANNMPSVSVIEGDEFYTGGSLKLWSSRQVSENARCCIDWKNQHSVISALKAKGVASWYAFDWHSENWDSDRVPYCNSKSTCSTTAVVLLEGVYSGRTELTSLFDLRVMLEVPGPVREKQLIAREGENIRTDWEQLWAQAEQYYFDDQLNYHSLDLILA